MNELRKVFRAYDIRGIYPTEINEEFAFNIGRAFGTFLNGNGKVVVGMDNRLSSYSLKENLIKGLISSGINVFDVKIVHTPFIIFSTAFNNLDGGIMITSSHNPKEWNGFLFYGKNGLSISYGSGMEKIEKIFFSRKFTNGNGTISEKRDWLNVYYDFISSKIKTKNLNKLKVVVDAGNGVGGEMFLPLAEKFKINLIKLFFELDGNFPNREPEPTKENLKELSKKVVEENANIGFAFDGDCDRVVVCDENGNILSPTKIFGILIKAIKPKKVVYDALSSTAIKELIKKLNGETFPCKVGHVFIQRKVVENNAEIGGEVSGHYFFNEIYGADDAIFATLKILEYVHLSNKNVSELVEDIPEYPFNVLRVKTIDEKKFEFIESLKKEFEEKGYEVDCLDGVKVIFDYGWALFRASNTEPKIVISYEAKDENSFKKIESFVNEIVNKIPK